MSHRRFTKSLAGTTLTAGALGLAALGFAGTASATAVDDAFIAQIEADGIQPPSSSRAISEAHTVCTELNAGTSSKQVIANVAQRTGLSSKGANTFAIDAAKSYCPQYVKTTTT